MTILATNDFGVLQQTNSLRYRIIRSGDGCVSEYVALPSPRSKFTYQQKAERRFAELGDKIKSHKSSNLLSIKK